MDRGDHKKGFTLIEMLVILAIIAIVVTLSAPLSNIYLRNRAVTQVQEFVSTLNVARSEAVSRGITVTLCIPERPVDDEGNPELDPDSGNPILRCAGPNATVDWSDGWIVFTDNNPNDCNIDVLNGDEIIAERNEMPEGFSLEVDDHNCIKYTAAGITPDTSGLWTLCDPSANDAFKRGINLSVSGRAQILDVDRAASERVNLANCPDRS